MKLLQVITKARKAKLRVPTAHASQERLHLLWQIWTQRGNLLHEAERPETWRTVSRDCTRRAVRARASTVSASQSTSAN